MNEQNNRVRVLHVVAQEPIGGVGSYLQSIFEFLSKQNFKFILLESSSIQDGVFNKKIKVDYGVEINKLPSLKIVNIFKYLRAVNLFYKKNADDIDIIHVHAPNIAFIHFFFAKKYGISKRVLQLHSTKYSSGKLKAYRNKILIRLAIRNTTDYVSTSSEANQILERTIHRSSIVLPNMINASIYFYNEKNRNIIRNRLGINNDDILIGVVGNFLPGKNQEFLVLIGEQLKKNIKFVFIGDGPQKEQLKKMIFNKGMAERFIFLGKRDDVNKLYSAFDLFVNPSEFEGFSRVVLEAQLNGLYCVVSKGIPKSVVLADDAVTFLEINDKNEWVNALNSMSISFLRRKHKKSMKKLFADSLFNPNNAQKYFEKLYLG